jgi:hypothetical protein
MPAKISTLTATQKALRIGFRDFAKNLGGGSVLLGYLAFVFGFQEYVTRGVRIAGSLGPEALGVATSLLL